MDPTEENNKNLLKEYVDTIISQAISIYQKFIEGERSNIDDYIKNYKIQQLLTNKKKGPEESDAVIAQKFVDKLISQAISIYRKFVESEEDNIEEFISHYKEEHAETDANNDTDEVKAATRFVDSIIAEAIDIYEQFLQSNEFNIKEFIKKYKNIQRDTEISDRESTELEDDASESSFYVPGVESVSDFCDLMKAVEPPLNIEWCFGLSSNLTIHYLEKDLIAYCASHFVIIFNIATKDMKFLKGLTNEISDISTGDGIIVVADSGIENVTVILWSTADLAPIKFWLNPLQGGISLIKISPCGEYVIAVSAIIPPRIARWEINGSQFSNGGIPVNCSPKHLASHPTNSDRYAITFATSIEIINYDNEFIDIVTMEIPKTIAKLGSYLTSLFLDNLDEIMTGTSQGMIVIWECGGKYIKTIEIHKTSLTWMQIIDGIIVIACDDGTLRLYEKNLCIRKWYQLDSGSIRCMTFTSNTDSPLPDFAYVTPTKLGIVANSRKIKQSMEYNPAFVISMEINAVNSKLLTGDSLGFVSIYKLSSKKHQLKQSLFDCAVTYLKFSSEYTVLAAGSDYGDILILDPIICSIKHILRSARYSIHKIHLSEDGLTLCYIHKGFGTGLFRCTIGWHFRGKCVAHRDEIIDSSLVGYRLFTVGKDRMLSEFNIHHMLRLVTQFRIEDRAIPTSCVWSDNFLLVANNENRIRFIDVERKEIIKTIRSPGISPLQIMQVVDDQLFYATGKDIGICQIPVVSWNSSMQVHGSKVINFCVFNKKIITCALNDHAVFMWSINTLSPIIWPSVSAAYHKIIRKKLKGVRVTKSNLMNSLKEVGFSPSEFEAINILREYQFVEYDIKTLAEIICHHGPPPSMTEDENEKNHLKSSDHHWGSGKETYHSMPFISSPETADKNLHAILTDMLEQKWSKSDNSTY